MANWSLDFSPMLPGPLYWMAVAAAILLVGVMLFRRTRGAVFRAVALAAMMMALANPTLR